MSTTIYDTLTNASAVTSIVSDRISLAPAPNTQALPYITYQFITSNNFETLITDECDANRHRIQIDMYAQDTDSLTTLFNAVRAAVKPVISSIQFFNPALFESETEIWRAILDVTIIE